MFCHLTSLSRQPTPRTQPTADPPPLIKLDTKFGPHHRLRRNPLPLINRFTLPYSPSAVDDLHARLARSRWPDELLNSTEHYGLPLNVLADLCTYWRDRFDWQAQIHRLSAFDHYTFNSAEGKIHFLHAKGKGPAPLPLILTHGWPGSFLEFLDILPLLTDPAAHGGDPADSFDLVIPSLPGFGFSDRPTNPGINSFRVAHLWVDLMHALGYDRFAAQGGDIGAAVTTALGLRHSQHLLGIHLNYIPGSYKPHLPSDTPLTSAEQLFTTTAAQWYDQNGAYAHLQGTRPQTPAYALNDSPSGLAAWLIEKFRDWSDCGGDLYSTFSRDQLLTNVTLYWMTQTISSSFRMYYENRRTPLQFTEDDFVHPPTAIACFPKEILSPPREWVERGYNVQRWTQMPRGGHFAAAEQPVLLAADLRAFFKTLRL